METTHIEITQVTLVSGIALSPRKRVIGAAHITLIDADGLDGTSIISLSTGEKFNVSESYDELKAILGVGYTAGLHAADYGRQPVKAPPHS